jgi:hypothetical protein
MKASVQKSSESESLSIHESITLYDLIEAVGDEVDPEHEKLVVDTVLDLFKSGKVRFKRKPVRGRSRWH